MVNDLDFDLMRALKPSQVWAALRARQPVIWVLITSLVLRLLLATIAPLGVDEAYAVAVSRSHSLSYFDHPALSFGMARLMADLFGEVPFLMRLPFVIMGTATAILLYDVTRVLSGARAGFWAVLLFSAASFFMISAGMQIVPDGPLNFFLIAALWWALPLLTFDQSIVEQKRWVGAGACLGLAALSKYHAALFVIGAGLAILSHKPWRRVFWQPTFWIGVGLAILGWMPALIWNAGHEWVSFRFQTARAVAQATPGEHIVSLLKLLAGQALYLWPWVWFWSLKSVWSQLRSPIKNAAYLLALIAVVIIFTFDLIALLGHDSLPHWAMIGFLIALPLVGARCAEMESKARTNIVALTWGSGVVIASLALGIALQAQTAFLTRWSYAQAPKFDLDWQSHNWTKARSILASPHDFVVTPNWIEAGRIATAAGPQNLVILSDPHHFQYMGTSPKPAQSGVFIAALSFAKADRDEVFLLKQLQSKFHQTGPVRHIIQDRLGFASFILLVVPVERSK